MKDDGLFDLAHVKFFAIDELNEKNYKKILVTKLNPYHFRYRADVVFTVSSFAHANSQKRIVNRDLWQFSDVVYHDIYCSFVHEQTGAGTVRRVVRFIPNHVDVLTWEIFFS